METPISANCAICFFLSSRDAGRSDCGGGGGGAAERFQGGALLSLPAADDDEEDPETVCRSLSTSLFAFCDSRCCCSLPRWMSRKKRLRFPWCLPLASCWDFSNAVSRMYILHCLHQNLGWWLLVDSIQYTKRKGLTYRRLPVLCHG